MVKRRRFSTEFTRGGPDGGRGEPVRYESGSGYRDSHEGVESVVPGTEAGGGKAFRGQGIPRLLPVIICFPFA
jgi:hypothetical protein